MELRNRVACLTGRGTGLGTLPGSPAPPPRFPYCAGHASFRSASAKRALHRQTRASVRGQSGVEGGALEHWSIGPYGSDLGGIRSACRRRFGRSVHWAHARADPVAGDSEYHEDRVDVVGWARGVAEAGDREVGAGDSAGAELDGARVGGGVRAIAARGAGHHAGQRAGAPRVVRLRPAGLPGRPRSPGVPRHRVRSARGGRGRTRELLHRGQRRPHHRPARGAHQDRGVACGWSIGSRRSGCPASKCWSSRSRSTASCWSCAAPASRDVSPRRIPRRSASRRSR